MRNLGVSDTRMPKGRAARLRVPRAVGPAVAFSTAVAPTGLLLGRGSLSRSLPKASAESQRLPSTDA
jgi:hypothetical protein